MYRKWIVYEGRLPMHDGECSTRLIIDWMDGCASFLVIDGAMSRNKEKLLLCILKEHLVYHP